MRIAITGAKGLIGWHAHARLHAANRAEEFRNKEKRFDIVSVDHPTFNDDLALTDALVGADAILHFAGVNRASADQLETANPAIASRLVTACKAANVKPHIVYANSTHASSDTPYGRSKRIAGDILEALGGGYSDIILPHIFGEGARPNYNNVTATFIAQIIAGERPDINPNGRVDLLHAGAAAQTAIDAMIKKTDGLIIPSSYPMSVTDLFKKLLGFHVSYTENTFPNLSDPLTRNLFNSYRAATYPSGWPRPLTLHADARGALFEAVKGGGGGQSFLSTTKPGITRGDHFHLEKVERFLVVQGEAIIRVRKVLTDEVWEFRVSGDNPAAVDMPTLHTHSIENVGNSDLLTLFWTHELFDPDSPDTYAEKVLS